jgi:hypothetical protein
MVVAAALTPSGGRRATSNACGASAQPLLDLGLLREMLAPRTNGAGAVDNSMGADTSSDRLRQSARCTKCGHKGATLQHPGWAGAHIGFQPFPLPRELLTRLDTSQRCSKPVPLDFTSMTTTYKSFRSCPVRMRSFGRGT